MTKTFTQALIGFVFVVVSLGAAATATAKGGKKAAEAAPPGATGPANACGCYTTGAGACICTKKGKCGCPGECEPKGCEEKRQKEIERQIAAETKKAAEADKKQRNNERARPNAGGKSSGDDAKKKSAQ